MSSTRTPPAIQRPLNELRPFARKVREGRVRLGHPYSLCVKAAFAKAYDFAVYANKPAVKERAFFSVATLRGICEDIIVLGCLSRMPRSERERLTEELMMHDVFTRITVQTLFFKRERPYQTIVVSSAGTAAKIQSLEASIQAAWRSTGWNLKHGVLPQVRQLAERQGEPFLAALYDFLYRVTSGMVHFSPHVLLRSGWGKGKAVTFSVRNFDQYYAAFARTYSLYLLCVYFERFRRFLRPSKQDSAAVRLLREGLRKERRWPEIVTFEEMNLPPPRLQILAELARTASAMMGRRRPLVSL